jgi:hypothetical protein
LPTVYLETTIPSYLTGWPSPDLLTAAKQQVTWQWWESRSSDFDLFISQAVLLEASAGDPEAAARRLESLDGITLLEPKKDSDEIVQALVEELSLPDRAIADAVHIAISVAHGIDFLLTWNFTHIANAAYRPIIDSVCNSFGYRSPVICSPEELMER